MVGTMGDGRTGVQEMITFVIGAQEFCVNVTAVREIRVWTAATPVAHAPPYMQGIINLRGAVLPIIDLAARLGFGQTEPSSRHAILVVEIGADPIGLLVDGVSEILTVAEAEIQPTPQAASDTALAMVTGIVAIDKRMISLLALDAILPSRTDRWAA